MRNECNIIRDILPIYVEKLASTDTASFVEEHLETCPSCRGELERMKMPDTIPIHVDVAPLKNLKKKLMVKKLQTVLLTVVLALAIAASVFAVLDAPAFYPYSPDLLTVTENLDGSVTITFSEKVTGHCLYSTAESDTNRHVYHVEAWYSVWDQQFSDGGIRSATVQPPENGPLTIYYTQNNGAEDVCVYGRPFSGGVISLPRLALGYWLLFAVLLLGGLLVLRFVFRNEKVKIWIDRAMLLPVSYVLGHLIVCGFTTVTYAMQRDFTLIISVAFLIWCGLLLGHSVCRLRREIREAEEL